MRDLSNSKVYAEYFMQFKEPKEDPFNDEEEKGSIDRSPMQTHIKHYSNL